MTNNATGALHASGSLSCTATYTGENDVVPPLLNHDDYATFQSLDLDFFLQSAGDRIRNYCRWHVFPVLTHTLVRDITGDGTIMLPTKKLLNVVTIQPMWAQGTILDPSTYTADRRGWVSFTPFQFGFAPTPATANLWPIDTVRLFDAYPKHANQVLITFTHGYATIPPTLQTVAFELVMRALEKPAGVASDVQAGPYRYKFNEFGFVLSEDQKNRLTEYRLPGAG